MGYLTEHAWKEVVRLKEGLISILSKCLIFLVTILFSPKEILQLHQFDTKKFRLELFELAFFLRKEFTVLSLHWLKLQ
jgi:hypothetical protein